MRRPDLSFCKSGESYKEIFGILQGGIGRQYQLARRSFSPVAVLWSATSQRAAFVAGKFIGFVKAEAETVDTLRLAGFDPYFVSDEQVAAGELKAKGVKALFLPMTLSIGMGDGQGSLPVWQGLKKYMDNGGVVIKTDEPDRDEFLRPIKAPAGFEKTVLFSGVKEKLASELASRGIKPVVVILNKDIKPQQKFKTYVHELKSDKKTAGYLVSFLCMPEDMKQVFGPDGVPYYVSESGVLKAFKVTADCSALKYTACYDRQLGKRIDASSGKAELEVTPCKGNILAFLPYVLKGVTASMKTENSLLKVDWSIDRENTDVIFAAHAVRVDVFYAETGKVNADLSGNYTSDMNGKGSAVIPLAITEAGKRWKVVVTDMITGMKGDGK